MKTAFLFPGQGAQWPEMARASCPAPVSIAAFLWVSSAGMSTAMGVFETMFRSPERPWYVRRAVAMGAMIASFVALLIVLTVSIFLASALGGVVARPRATT